METEARTTLLVQDRAVAIFEGFYDGIGDKLPCEYCGEWGYLERHHRQFRSRGGLWIASNVILLCRRHHHMVTVCPDSWAADEGLSVSQWAKPQEVAVRVWYVEGFVLLDDDGGYTKVDKAA